MERKIRIESVDQARWLLGPQDENLKLIQKEFGVKLALRGEHLKIAGNMNAIKRAEAFISHLLERPEGGPLTRSEIFFLSRNFKGEAQELFQPSAAAPGHFEAAPRHTHVVMPKTKGQREYYDAIRGYDIVFGVGPAGTGKTYLAVACAVEALKAGQVRRLILTRPALEAGESLGFLPGDISEKIGPYLRPLYAALYDMMDADRIEKYVETGIIEMAPLAYMRGRTLNDAFIILDEAQNATAEQMKMFLTRMGFDSKAVITGDITQSDLPGGKPIGLLQAMEKLRDIEAIKFVSFTGADVVRHELVQKIITAYEKPSAK
jgi:phosphate starvation-inducible protein PhoH and related proteins